MCQHKLTHVRVIFLNKLHILYSFITILIMYLIISNVTHIFIVRDILFQFWTECHETWLDYEEAEREQLAQTKIWFKVIPSEFLPLLQLPPYLRDRGTLRFIVQKLLLQFSTKFHHIWKVYHCNSGGDLRWLAPSLLNPFRQYGLILYVRSFIERVYGMLPIKWTVSIGSMLKFQTIC